MILAVTTMYSVSDSEKLMNDFMSNKNKEVLGESVVIESDNDDNYLADTSIIKSGFSNESVSEDDKTTAVVRNIMNTMIAIPILIGSIFFVLFLVMKIGSSVLNFIRGFFIRLSGV